MARRGRRRENRGGIAPGIRVVRDAEEVFRAAILAGVLSAERSRRNWAGHYLYMFHDEGRHRLVQAPRHPFVRLDDGPAAGRGASAVSEVRVVLSTMVLAAGVAAAVAAGAVRLSVDEGPRIASVRLAELAAEHAERAAHGGRFSRRDSDLDPALGGGAGAEARRHRRAPGRGAAAFARGRCRRAGRDRCRALHDRGQDETGHVRPGGPAVTGRAILAARGRGGKRAWIGLALMTVLAALWLATASRVHVNASWSDDAWGLPRAAHRRARRRRRGAVRAAAGARRAASVAQDRARPAGRGRDRGRRPDGAPRRCACRAREEPRPRRTAA